MRPEPVTLWRSTVFGRIMAGSALFVVLALAAMWGLGLVAVARLDRTEAAELRLNLAEATDILLAEGRAGLMEAIGFDGDSLILDEDDIFYFLEEEIPLFALRDGADLQAGFGGLWPDAPLLDHPEIDTEVQTATATLRNGQELTVARFVPERRYEIWWFLRLGTFGLLIIGLPLALTTGVLTSRQVFRRLEGLATTAEAVGSGDLEARAPLTGAHDEFDRLGMGVNQMLDKLVALTRNVEAVTVGVAHDLKTPLAHIRGRLDLIHRDRADPAAVEAHVAQAEDRLEGLLRIFDALLRLGEIEAGRRRSAFAPVDLGQLARDLGDSYAPLFEDADKTLEVAALSGLTMSGDSELLTQALANLLENAAEHARDGAHVQLSVQPTDGGLRVTVADDGPGIPPAARDRIFERFFRAEASRSTPGNGLGLALVKAIAELHGGTALLRPDPDRAVFDLDFPRDSR